MYQIYSNHCHGNHLLIIPCVFLLFYNLQVKSGSSCEFRGEGADPVSENKTMLMFLWGTVC